MRGKWSNGLTAGQMAAAYTTDPAALRAALQSPPSPSQRFLVDTRRSEEFPARRRISSSVIGGVAVVSNDPPLTLRP